MKIYKRKINLLFKKKEIGCRGIHSYWPTILIEYIQSFTFLDIVEHTGNNIGTNMTLLTLLLKVFAIFKMRLWYGNENVEGNVVDNIDVRCSNCGKITGLYMKNTNYRDMVSKFVLN